MDAYTERAAQAAAGAIRKLADLVAYSGEDCEDIATAIVEQVIEAAAGRVFHDIKQEGARRRRLEAMAELEQDLCPACVDRLGFPPPVADQDLVGKGDPNVPGSVELAERELFLGWRRRAAELEPTGEEGSPREALIFELHASRSQRHPLGIAEDLSHAIEALHTGDDQEAVDILDNLAEAELQSALSEKRAAFLGAVKVVVDPDADELEAAALVAEWTVPDLDRALLWADAEFSAATSGAVVPPKPECVAALERKLGK